MERPGDLPIGHAADGVEQDLRIELGPLLPVSGGEGLATEVAAAGEACEPLDTVGADAAQEEAAAFVAPALCQAVVVHAVGIGAVRRMPAGSSGVHTRPVARNRPGTISEAQLNC